MKGYAVRHRANPSGPDHGRGPLLHGRDTEGGVRGGLPLRRDRRRRWLCNFVDLSQPSGSSPGEASTWPCTAPRVRMHRSSCRTPNARPSVSKPKRSIAIEVRRRLSGRKKHHRMRTTLVPDGRGYTAALLGGLAEQGWLLTALPEAGRLAPNRQKLTLHTAEEDTHLRLHVYKVTGTGRSRANESRIEITTTYVGGRLIREAAYADVVLGFDATSGTFVGFDPRRLDIGGQSHNASSFFHQGALGAVDNRSLKVYPQNSAIFGTEFNAFFRPSRAAEYLLNLRSIHSGTYVGGGSGSLCYPARSQRRMSVASINAEGQVVSFSEPPGRPLSPRMSHSIVEDLESTGIVGGRAVPPDELERARHTAAINGLRGERYVLDAEIARLQREGRPQLAAKVQWTSQFNAAAGFDIESYEADGTERYIEVKSTQGTGNIFQMSCGEWRVAERRKQKYLVARVRNVLEAQPDVSWYRDPVLLESSGALSRTPDGYFVSVD